MVYSVEEEEEEPLLICTVLLVPYSHKNQGCSQKKILTEAMSMNNL